jgi:hypothetical protein
MAAARARFPVGRLLALALPLYFAWEMLQMPAYAGVPRDWVVSTTWCALATLGDALMALATFAAGAVVFGDAHWWRPLRVSRLVAVVGIGIAIHVGVEWVFGVRLDLWRYASWHPVIPGLEVGLSAVLQPLVLLPLIGVGLAWWQRRADRP